MTVLEAAKQTPQTVPRQTGCDALQQTGGIPQSGNGCVGPAFGLMAHAARGQRLAGKRRKETNGTSYTRSEIRSAQFIEKTLARTDAEYKSLGKRFYATTLEER